MEDAPTEVVPEDRFPRGSPLYDISETALGELERLIPKIVQRLSHGLSPEIRGNIRVVQKILSDVRWSRVAGLHGPVYRVDFNDGTEPPTLEKLPEA